MTKVGQYIIAGTKRLIIPNGQDAWFQFTHEGERIDFRVVFESDEDAKAQPSLRYEGRNDHALLTFRNWSNPLGQATITPIRVGVTDKGIPISFMAACWAIGNSRILEVQAMLGGAE
jgi:hypothetical protein